MVNPKRVVAAIGVAALLLIIVYPALATGTVLVQVRSDMAGGADHVYVNVDRVWAHPARQPADQGWTLILNSSRSIDLTALRNATALGTEKIRVGDYDAIRIEISNVTWVQYGTKTPLQLQQTAVSAGANFTVGALSGNSVVLDLSGRQETIFGAAYFTPSLNATSTLH